MEVAPIRFFTAKSLKHQSLRLRQTLNEVIVYSLISYAPIFSVGIVLLSSTAYILVLFQTLILQLVFWIPLYALSQNPPQKTLLVSRYTPVASSYSPHCDYTFYNDKLAWSCLLLSIGCFLLSPSTKDLSIGRDQIASNSFAFAFVSQGFVYASCVLDNRFGRKRNPTLIYLLSALITSAISLSRGLLFSLILLIASRYINNIISSLLVIRVKIILKILSLFFLAVCFVILGAVLQGRSSLSLSISDNVNLLLHYYGYSLYPIILSDTVPSLFQDIHPLSFLGYPSIYIMRAIGLSVTNSIYYKLNTPSVIAHPVSGVLTQANAMYPMHSILSSYFGTFLAPVLAVFLLSLFLLYMIRSGSLLLRNIGVVSLIQFSSSLITRSPLDTVPFWTSIMSSVLITYFFRNKAYTQILQNVE